MHSVRHQIHNVFKSTAEMVIPVLSSSAFREKGVLTPEEFILAGDMLVQSCPTWSWAAGDAKHSKPYLPTDKQYLVTRNVPCFRRAAEVQGTVADEELISGDGMGDDWVATINTRDAAGVNGEVQELPTISGEGIEQAPGGSHSPVRADAEDDGDVPDIDDIPDIDDLAIDEEDDDEAVIVGGVMDSDGIEDDGIIRTRTYDLSITYDKYYQTPRFWLVGYDELKQPMPPSKILEDVSEEHARKTITVDPHPNNPAIRAASIHPCKHANVMKKLIGELSSSGLDVSVEQYLVLFIKFIASIVPTIEYDYTMSVGSSA